MSTKGKRLDTLFEALQDALSYWSAHTGSRPEELVCDKAASALAELEEVVGTMEEEIAKLRGQDTTSARGLAVQVPHRERFGGS